MEAQVPEDGLHKDLSQLGVRVAGSLAQAHQAVNLGETQQGGYMAVVLETDEDDAELHPLTQRETTGDGDSLQYSVLPL